MGNKPRAKALALSLGIPVPQSRKIDVLSAPVLEETEYPVLIKASFGGGGKGMEIVHSREELTRQVIRSSRMALNYFGNGEVFIEQYIPNARHVEVQIIGDNYGNIIHLFERECSIQRNHQKIIEEAPAIFLTTDLREKLLSAALKIGEAINYSGAGTVEFLIDGSGNYYFIEMNPRIQVEHAVTEQVTGIDIVSEQLKIASGYRLSILQQQVIVRGHAIEIRIYSENPVNDFAPSSLPLFSVNLPDHPKIRIESDLKGKNLVKNLFDPLILKLIVWENDRENAFSLLRKYIRNLNITGPETNVKYLETIIAHPDYQQNNISVDFCQNNHNALIREYLEKSSTCRLPFLIAFVLSQSYLQGKPSSVDPWQYLGYWRLSPHVIQVSVDDQVYNTRLNLADKSKRTFELNGTVTDFEILNNSGNWIEIQIDNKRERIYYGSDNNGISITMGNIRHKVACPGLLKNYPETPVQSGNASTMANGEIISPMHGKIQDIHVKENQLIKKGDLLMVIEAMKSENRILSPKDAKVKKIAVNVGAQVTDRMPLIFLEE